MEKLKGRYGKYLLVNEAEKKESQIFIKFFTAFEDRFPEQFMSILVGSIEEISNVTQSRLTDIDSERYDCVEELSAYIHSCFIDEFYDFALEYFKEHECYALCHNIHILQEAVKKFRKIM